MLRKCVLALFAISLVIAVATSWRGESTAQPRVIPTEPPDNAPRPAALVKPANPLPIRDVVLFNSGVGYFQRAGDVENDARVDLQFSAANINDLIKSLIVEDRSGKLFPLRFDSQEPVEKTLKSFAIDLSTNPSFGEILNQARGQKVEVTLSNNNATGLPGSMTGSIVLMETQQRAAAGPTQPAGEIELLNLMCAEGMRSVPLKDVQRLRFLNPAIETELRRALDVVAVGHDSQRKAVRLDFRGEGKRNVKVGYVVENPIWKTSYRLVLAKDGKPRLIGWANIENTSDEDWNDVNLTLVASRPISFQMDLYPPLYVPRPTVEPELYAALRPPTYQGPLMGQTGMAGMSGNVAGMAGDPASEMGRQNVNLGVAGGVHGYGAQWNMSTVFHGQNVNLGVQGGVIGNRYSQAGFGQTGMARLSYGELQSRRRSAADPALDPANTVQTAKQIGSNIANLDPELVEAALLAQHLGNPSRFAIEEKVTLPRQQSAMLPLLDMPVEAARVSIYNERVQATHPLLGLKVKNTSKRALMQGPITVYDGEQYSGDARILDLQPGEERLVSYAVDTAVEIKPQERTAPGPEMTITLRNGQLLVQYRLRQTRTYVIANRSPEDRQVVIEQPVQEGWQLVVPEKPAEQTRDLYRFAVKVKAGETVKFDVAEEEPRLEPFESNKTPDFNGFATTLGLDVWTETQRTPEEQMLLQVVPSTNAAEPGVLKVTHHDRRTTTYFVRNRAPEARTILLEHAVAPLWKLLGDAAPIASNANRFRFKMELPPGETASQAVVQELRMPEAESFALKLVEGTPPPRPGTDDLPRMRYVTELGFEVWLDKRKNPDALVSAKFDKGQLATVSKESESLVYHVRNRIDQQRTLIVEHVVRPDWTFVGAEKPTPGAGQRYRFSLKPAQDEVLKVQVTEQHLAPHACALSAIPEARFKEIMASAAINQKVKDTLRTGRSMIAAHGDTQRVLAELRGQMQIIETEQARLRLNIEKLPKDAPLYKRYLDKLDQEETALEKVRTQIAQRADAEKQQAKDLAAFLEDLNVE